jgi:hypothetical protein
MTLAGQVVAHLRSHGVRSAVIGGVAMAVHGIARATVDLDVLVVSPKALDAAAVWSDMQPDVTVRVSKGDASDPLAGVVRCTSGDAVVDVVVGSSRWMDEAISRAIERDVAGERLPVVDAADLVLLKLYAGGPQDMLDVRLLFAADSGLRAVVQTRIGSAPPSVIARLGDVGLSTT